jgi:hypothetical protein
MRVGTVIIYSAAAQLAAAAPFSFPLPNGFPNPNITALREIFKLAGGTVPEDGFPTNLSPSSVQTLQLIAANELFEVAYFTELLQNITERMPGYECDPYVVDALTAVVNVTSLPSSSFAI